jgi:flagellar basal-body rod protein FlgC
MKIGKLLSGFDLSALGMRAQRKKMDAIAENIANTETTRTEKGGPYRRKTIAFTAGPHQTFARLLAWSGMRLDTTNTRHFEVGGAAFSENEDSPGGVEGKEQEDPSQFKMVHDPGHPDADENGYVQMPNVNIVSEMVDMIAASRSFEANATAISAAKGIAKDSLEI